MEQNVIPIDFKSIVLPLKSLPLQPGNTFPKSSKTNSNLKTDSSDISVKIYTVGNWYLLQKCRKRVKVPAGESDLGWAERKLSFRSNTSIQIVLRSYNNLITTVQCIFVLDVIKFGSDFDFCQPLFPLTPFHTYSFRLSQIPSPFNYHNYLTTQIFIKYRPFGQPGSFAQEKSLINAGVTRHLPIQCEKMELE